MSSNTIIDNIVSKVKEKATTDLKLYLIVTIPILILLTYLIYKYNYKSRTSNIINSLDYKSKINVKPLQKCYEVDAKYQYKLCDYYISSSFMTPCIGNQHYDYVSNDMILNVLQSGARYIQIPICEADVSYKALPVVATAEYGQKVITSLNTLDLSIVLKTIRNNAFIINNKEVNYPLIVHLILNTNNPYTLEVVANNIQEILSDVLVDVKKYNNTPIFLEKLCNLLNKIIIFATPEYMNTKLEHYIIPTNKLFEIYHFEELGSISIPKDSIFTNSYNRKLSTKEQSESNITFKKKYPSIDYILKNADSIGKIILNDKEILNNLSNFNKIGMSIVKPHYPADVISKNFDTTESIYLGCQFVAMNFQINDTNLESYIEIFKNSSFRLKPDSMRFSEIEEKSKDLISIYDSILKINENILNDFYFKYNNLLLVFESYTLPNTFLTQIENNLRINVGSKKTKNNAGQITYKNGIEQCFIPRKSRVGSADNVSIYLESAAMPSFFITFNGNTFILQKLGSNKKELVNQAFYVEKGKIQDNEQDRKLFSIRTVSDDNPFYIAFENKTVKAYKDSPQLQAQNNMSFFIDTVKFKIVIKIITLFDDSLKTMSGNIIGVLENNTTDGTSYYILPASKNSTNNNNFDIFKHQFILKNKEKNTYVSYDNNNQYLYDKEIEPNLNSIFSIEAENGYYKILNTNGDNLILFNRNLIKFETSAKTVTNENLFKLDINYELE